MVDHGMIMDAVIRYASVSYLTQYLPTSLDDTC